VFFNVAKLWQNVTAAPRAASIWINNIRTSKKTDVSLDKHRRVWEKATRFTDMK
jgi:hypothetical protein